MVVTSTAGVFGSSVGQQLIDETSDLAEKPQTDYERSKILAEQAVLSEGGNGLKTVIINPTRVFGPGPLNESNSLTKIIDRYMRGLWRIVPGNGESVGNYVYVDDVVEGHLLAMHHPNPAPRYILGGENLSYNQWFDMLATATGRKRWMVHLPFTAIQFLADTQMIKAKWLRTPPLITPAFARKYRLNYRFSIQRAQEQLGYQPGSVLDGIRATIEWLRVER